MWWSDVEITIYSGIAQPAHLEKALLTCPAWSGVDSKPGWMLISVISALCSKFYPRNINYMPAVKFFAGLDLEQKSSFLDGH